MDQEQLKEHIKQSWIFYKETLKSAKYVLAPMVDQSELAFRLLCRKYGAQLCYSPMLHSKVIQENPKYQEIYLQNRREYIEQDSPFIIQFCGNDAEVLVNAGKMVENDCDAIDLNLGCPQGIAKKGHYGSYLLNEPELIFKLVWAMKTNLKVPITCKIRVLDNEQKTLNLALGLQKHGCSLLTVHGRTKEQKKDLTGPCDWNIIKKIKETISIPVIANGGIYTYQDVQNLLKFTGCDGVMSSEGALENVGIFQNEQEYVDLDEIALEYIDLAEKHNEKPGWVKAHLFKILYAGLQQNVDLRTKLAIAKTYQEFREIQKDLKERRKNLSNKDKFGWYWRHLKFNNKKNEDEDKLNQVEKINDQEKLNQLNQKIDDEKTQNQKDNLVDNKQNKNIKNNQEYQDQLEKKLKY